MKKATRLKKYRTAKLTCPITLPNNDKLFNGSDRPSFFQYNGFSNDFTVEEGKYILALVSAIPQLVEGIASFR